MKKWLNKIIFYSNPKEKSHMKFTNFRNLSINIFVFFYLQNENETSRNSKHRINYGVISLNRTLNKVK
jgi:hypothetical protein